MKERDVQRKCVELLHEFSWATNSVQPMLDQNGLWRTGTSAKGWPDVTALRGSFIIGIECKGPSAPREIPAKQLEWLARFAAIPTGKAWLVRHTSDFEQLARWMAWPEDAPKVYGWSANPPVQRAML